MDWHTFLHQGMMKAWDHIPGLILGIITFVIGWWAIGRFRQGFKMLLERNKVDPTLHTFLTTSSTVLLKIVLILSIAGSIGFETASMLAVLGGAGLTIGFALQGSLSNLAGGVLILVLRPFKVGDLIEAQDYMGYVQSIHLFNTELKTKEKLTVILPNGPLAGSSIVNYSTEPIIRMHLTVGIDYGDSIDKARALMLAEAEKMATIAKSPKSEVFVEKLGDNSVDMMIRFWVSYIDESTTPYLLCENIKKSFDRNGITIPFPQRVVHLSTASSPKPPEKTV